MADPLILKKTDPKTDSYTTIYEHPEFGRIDVGSISPRASNPTAPDNWYWCIRTSALAPAQVDESGELKQRSSVSFEGTAPTKKAAIAAWKAHWPKFRDARSDAEWHDIKADQDYGRKRIMVYDALKLPLTAADREQLQAEMRNPGPASRWLLGLLEGKR